MLIVVGKQNEAKKKAVELVMDQEKNISPSDDSSESSLTTTGRMIRDKQLTTLIAKREDTDLDSIDDTSVNRNRVHEVELDQNDDASVASSLTEMSKEEKSESDRDSFSDFSISSAGSLSSGISTVMGLTRSDEMLKFIKQIASSSDKPLSDEELRLAVRNYQLRKFNKKQQMFTATLETFIATRRAGRNKDSNTRLAQTTEQNVEAQETKYSSDASILSKDTTLFDNSVDDGSDISNFSEQVTRRVEVIAGNDKITENSETGHGKVVTKDNEGNLQQTSGKEDGDSPFNQAPSNVNKSSQIQNSSSESNPKSPTNTASTDSGQLMNEDHKGTDQHDNGETDNSVFKTRDESENTTSSPNMISDNKKSQQSQTFDDDDPDKASAVSKEETVSTSCQRQKQTQNLVKRQSERLQLLNKSQRSSRS